MRRNLNNLLEEVRLFELRNLEEITKVGKRDSILIVGGIFTGDIAIALKYTQAGSIWLLSTIVTDPSNLANVDYLFLSEKKYLRLFSRYTSAPYTNYIPNLLFIDIQAKERSDREVSIVSDKDHKLNEKEIIDIITSSKSIVTDILEIVYLCIYTNTPFKSSIKDYDELCCSSGDYRYLGRKIISMLGRKRDRKVIDYLYSINEDRGELVVADFQTKIHRHGWTYAMNSLKAYLGSERGSIICDPFVEGTFTSTNLINNGTIPYTCPWIGFIHHTLNDKFTKDGSSFLVKDPLFLISLKTCCSLFFLSDYLAKQFANLLKENGITNVRIVSVYHPITSYPSMTWNSKCIDNEIKLVNVGYWYRNLTTISQIREIEGIKKFILKPASVDDREFSSSTVTIIDHLDDKSYDQLICNSVIFLHLYDASASNTILECIVHSIPLVVNRIPAVIEYLGVDYPLYFECEDEIPTILVRSKVIDAHQYLLRMNKDFIHIENFIRSIRESEFYQESIDMRLEA